MPKKRQLTHILLYSMKQRPRNRLQCFGASDSSFRFCQVFNEFTFTVQILLRMDGIGLEDSRNQAPLSQMCY